MASRNRATLRNYFKAGTLPTEEHFGDLIDSMLNMLDEGYRKTPEHGVEIASLGSTNALVSFYTQREPQKVQWSIAYGTDAGERAGKRLVFSAREAGVPGPSVLSFDPAGRVGINTDAPQHALDVQGIVRASGRLGGYAPDNLLQGPGGAPSAGMTGPVPADGQWQDITGWLEGCQAFEVTAGVGDRGKGRYALLHAVALNTFHPARSLFDWFRPRRRIRAAEAFYGTRCDRLELKWDGTGGKDARYRLLIRTRCPYSDGIRIQVHLQRLWFDPRMEGSLPAGEDR